MGLFGDILGGIGSWMQGDSDKDATRKLAGNPAATAWFLNGISSTEP